MSRTYVEEWLVSISPWETLCSDTKVFILHKLWPMSGHLAVFQVGVQADQTAGWDGDKERETFPQFIRSGWKMNKKKSWIREKIENCQETWNVDWMLMTATELNAKVDCYQSISAISTKSNKIKQSSDDHNTTTNYAIEKSLKLTMFTSGSCSSTAHAGHSCGNASFADLWSHLPWKFSEVWLFSSFDLFFFFSRNRCSNSVTVCSICSVQLARSSTDGVSACRKTGIVIAGPAPLSFNSFLQQSITKYSSRRIIHK